MRVENFHNAWNETLEDLLARRHHLHDQAYRDIDGVLLHDYKSPPKIHVMMIRSKSGAENRGEFYERLGIGQIYLKRWVEASPEFETIVLE